jgi:hypothetical protein
MNKKDLSERDICSKFIGPAVKRAGWDGMMQIREEVAFTKGRIIVRGKLVTRGKATRADYILYYKPNIPIAIIEAKDNNHSVGELPSLPNAIVVHPGEREPAQDQQGGCAEAVPEISICAGVLQPCAPPLFPCGAQVHIARVKRMDHGFKG